MIDWQEIFEVIWKTLLVFLVLVSLSRVIGKKLLAQITFFDFVIGVTIGTIGGAYVVTATKGLYVLISPVILTLAVIATGFTSLKSLRMRKILEGEPVVLVQNGKILDRNLFRARYNLDDLEMELRAQGVFDMSKVEFAVLEPHGQLSVLKKSQYIPVTPADIGLPTAYQGMATDLIKDGEILEQNLVQNRLDRSWLMEQLHSRGISDISKIIVASLNTDGTLYIDQRDDPMDYIQRIED